MTIFPFPLSSRLKNELSSPNRLFYKRKKVLKLVRDGKMTKEEDVDVSSQSIICTKFQHGDQEIDQLPPEKKLVVQEVNVLDFIVDSDSNVLQYRIEVKTDYMKWDVFRSLSEFQSINTFFKNVWFLIFWSLFSIYFCPFFQEFPNSVFPTFPQNLFDFFISEHKRAKKLVLQLDAYLKSIFLLDGFNSSFELMNFCKVDFYNNQQFPPLIDEKSGSLYLKIIEVTSDTALSNCFCKAGFAAGSFQKHAFCTSTAVNKDTTTNPILNEETIHYVMQRLLSHLVLFHIFSLLFSFSIAFSLVSLYFSY